MTSPSQWARDAFEMEVEAFGESCFFRDVDGGFDGPLYLRKEEHPQRPYRGETIASRSKGLSTLVRPGPFERDTI